MQSVVSPPAEDLASVWRGRAKRAGIVALALAPFALAVGLRLPICPSATLLGIPCPGCGLTRATLAALAGDFAQAFALHPLVFVLTPVYIGFIAFVTTGYVWGTKSTRASRINGKVATLLFALVFVAMIGLWALRFLGWFGGPVPLEPATSFTR